tara:strand:+ start:2677 stop:3720 length:1044 start_codon:yes stop_codon:yes gene_type:complete
MKVSIGTNIKDGPWGGGNLFAINLRNFLISNGIEVTNKLDDDDIDIILITEPRKTSESSSYTHVDVENYLKYINYETVVIHRINECDERKNTNYVNKYLIYANKIADETIFVSKWLKDLYLNQGLMSKINHVIYAGANREIFNRHNFNHWQKDEKIKIVTHHWGANWNKGFDTYLKLDELVGTKKWRDRIEFTYIGNIPKKLNFANTKVITPLSGNDLANEIKKNHLYITGSINEPSGNHHIESSQCGLPVLYINSGGIPEYCKGYGVEFKYENLESKLEEIIQNYDIYVQALKSYPNDSEKMSKEFLQVFENAINKKDSHLNRRVIKENNNNFLKSLHLLKKKYIN